MFWLLVGFDDKLQRLMNEDLESSMTPGHLRRLFWCIHKERAFLARCHGSLDVLRDSVIAEPLHTPSQGGAGSSNQSSQAEAKEARRAQAEAARQAARQLREARQEEKRAAEAERAAAREREAMVRQFETAQRVDASGQPVDEFGHPLEDVASGVDLRVNKATVWIRIGERERDAYGFGEEWEPGCYRAEIFELGATKALFSLPQLSQPKELPLSMVERVLLSARRQRAMHAQGEAFLSSLGQPVHRRHLLTGPQGAAPQRLSRWLDPLKPPPDLPHYHSLGGPAGTRPQPLGTEHDAEAVEIWAEAAQMNARRVPSGGAGVTWFLRGWRFLLESRRTDPKARDKYVWPPEAHTELGVLVKNDLCRLRSMSEVGRLLLGRVANLSDGWRPPAHGAIVELSRHGSWEHGRVEAVRGDGAFLASEASHRLKWFDKQGEGRDWRRTSAATLHLRVLDGRVRVLLSTCMTRTCHVSRVTDLALRRGEWRRCSACYKWRRAGGLAMADGALRCAVECNAPQELCDAQIDDELGISPWQPMSAEQLRAAQAVTQGRLAAEAEARASAVAEGGSVAKPATNCVYHQPSSGAGVPVAEEMDASPDSSQAEAVDDQVEGMVSQGEHDVEMAENNGAPDTELVGGNGVEAGAAAASGSPSYEVIDLTLDD